VGCERLGSAALLPLLLLLLLLLLPLVLMGLWFVLSTAL
jgi:hypothetical protein